MWRNGTQHCQTGALEACLELHIGASMRHGAEDGRLWPEKFMLDSAALPFDSSKYAITAAVLAARAPTPSKERLGREAGHQACAGCHTTGGRFREEANMPGEAFTHATGRRSCSPPFLQTHLHLSIRPEVA